MDNLTLEHKGVDHELFQLSEHTAQEIVDKMMQDIPYNINIMNDQGVIIGSGNRRRVGTIHQGAVKALATGTMIEVWADGRNEKQGTNEPIVIDNNRVGVIGITGNPDEVRPFCNLVRTTVSLLIEQGTALKNLHNEAERKKAFLEVLLNHHGVYTQKLQKEASAYQIDLHLKTTILYIKDMDLELDKSKLMLLYPCFLIEEGTYILMIQNQTNMDHLVQSLLRNHQQGCIAIGNLESNIGRGYQQAKSTMQVVKALDLSSRAITYEEVAFLVQLSEMQPLDKTNVISKLEDIPDMLETLQCFINHDCSVSLTADELNIHRNTLQYRLKRIHERTGKNPRNVLQLFELTHNLLSFYK